MADFLRPYGGDLAGKTVVIKGARVVVHVALVHEPGWVVVKDGLVVSVEVSRPEVEGAVHFEADIVTPGFVDIHTHGIGGSSNVCEFWRHPEYTTTRTVRYGTTSIIASIVIPREGNGGEIEDLDDGCACSLTCAADVDDVVLRVLEKLKPAVGRLGAGSVIEGIHAEGPVVADLGGLPQGDAQMSLGDFESLLDIIGPGLKIMTISPSVEANAPDRSF
jgi:N-acetylglucosamine-6-phosphate deacetylase